MAIELPERIQLTHADVSAVVVVVYPTASVAITYRVLDESGTASGPARTLSVPLDAAKQIAEQLAPQFEGVLAKYLEAFASVAKKVVAPTEPPKAGHDGALT